MCQLQLGNDTLGDSGRIQGFNVSKPLPPVSIVSVSVSVVSGCKCNGIFDIYPLASLKMKIMAENLAVRAEAICVPMTQD